MDIDPGFSTSFRVVRGGSGQWEVVEEGKKDALARFDAPQAALSYACSIAEARHGSLVVVFDQPLRRRSAPVQRSHPAARPYFGIGATA